MDTMHALSPLDGRYADRLVIIRGIFSEAALISQRTFVELHWLALLVERGIAPIATSQDPNNVADTIRSLALSIQPSDVKSHEKAINHDVKAVEYAIADILRNQQFDDTLIPFIHFALTSEDVNSTAYALMLRDGIICLVNELQAVIDQLALMAETHADTPMLARTHGQPATPTTVGKEFANFAYRLAHTLTQMPKTVAIKFSGATGNFNAHMIAYPDIQWEKLADDFAASLHLHRHPYCTQSVPHDDKAQLFDAIARINTILIDCCRDIWGYISFGYLVQRHEANEVGSSTMPHKINPIDFENAEGNLGIANALLRHYSDKLPISRFQRDLSDSTVLRTIGTAFGHCYIAYTSLQRGLAKCTVNATAMREDLDRHPSVLGEAIQTVMRAYGHQDAYEQLKVFTRGNDTITQDTLRGFIRQLSLPPDMIERLLILTPASYTGNAATKAKQIRAHQRNVGKC